MIIATARAMLSQCDGNLTSALNDATDQYNRGVISESDLLKLYDVLVALCMD